MDFLVLRSSDARRGRDYCRVVRCIQHGTAGASGTEVGSTATATAMDQFLKETTTTATAVDQFLKEVGGLVVPDSKDDQEEEVLHPYGEPALPIEQSAPLCTV